MQSLPFTYNTISSFQNLSPQNPILLSSFPHPNILSNSHSLSSPFPLPNPSKLSKTLKPYFPIKASSSSTLSSFRSKNPSQITVLVVGPTGYIGKFVVKELLRRGFDIVSVARERSGIRGRNSKQKTLEQLKGSTVCFSDVADIAALDRSLEDLGRPIDVQHCAPDRLLQELGWAGRAREGREALRHVWGREALRVQADS